MYHTISKKLISCLLFVVVAFGSSNLFANAPVAEDTHVATIDSLEGDGHKTEAEKGFNAGEMIMEHIKDAHEIHFITLHEGSQEEKHITLPLPVIIYSEKGLDIFSSSVFHHEHIYTSEKTGLSYEKNKEGHIIATDQTKLYDISITKNVAGMLVGILIMFVVFISIAKSYKEREGKAPKGLQSFLEPLIIFIRDEVAKPSIGHHYESYLPFLLSIFFFILINNLLGLIPFIGGFNITGNIAVTLVLALFTFAITLFKANANYWKHIFATPGAPVWLLPLLVPIEIMGLFTKPVVLTLRLFANITAGHIIMLSFFSLIFIFGGLYGSVAGYGVSLLSIAFTIFMNFLELLVAFLQAYVFTLLSALYFGSAIEEHHH